VSWLGEVSRLGGESRRRGGKRPPGSGAHHGFNHVFSSGVLPDRFRFPDRFP